MLTFRLKYVKHTYKRNMALRRNYSYNPKDFRYVVVNTRRRRCIRAFRTLKQANEYLECIKTFYEQKNRVVYMNNNSRSMSITDVAQYIGPDALNARRSFFGIYERFSIYRFRSVYRVFPFENSSKIARFEKNLHLEED